MRVVHTRTPYLRGAVEAAGGKFVSGGLANNWEFIDACVEFVSLVRDEFLHPSLRSANLWRPPRGYCAGSSRSRMGTF